ncbi:response regulator transcription factor [Tsuneonella sp. HG249]
MGVTVQTTFGSRTSDRSLQQLSDRELDVLAHLAGHKTSKAIARDLGIHENTVNKHLASIRAKWSTTDRYETAQVFTRLSEGDEIHPSQIPSGDDYLIVPSEPVADLPDSAHFRLSDVLAPEPFGFRDSLAPKGLEALDRRYGKVWRIAAIPIIGILFGMVMLVVVATAQVLNDLF